MAGKNKENSDFLKERSVSRKNSAIPYFCASAAKKVYRLASSGCIGSFLSTYDRAQAKSKEAFIVKKPRSIYNKYFEERKKKIETEELPDEAAGVVIYKENTLNRKITHKISSSWHSSWILSFVKRVKDGVINTQAASYGVLLLAFMLSMIVSQSSVLVLKSINSELGFLSYVLTTEFSDVIINCISTIPFIILSIPLMFSGGTLAELLFKSRITGGFLRGIMGFRDTEFVKKATPVPRNFRCFVIGWVLGFITLFISPVYMISLLAIFFFAAVTYVLPEAGVVILMFLLPFISFLENPLEGLVAEGKLLVRRNGARDRQLAKLGIFLRSWNDHFSFLRDQYTFFCISVSFSPGRKPVYTTRISRSGS